MHEPAPGTIRLRKFRVRYEECRDRAGKDDRFLLQQRAIIRLNEDLVKIECAEDFEVACNDAEFKQAAGKRPSALQYFVASIGFCMLSQMARFATKLRVRIDDTEMDLRMTYDLRATNRISDFATATQELFYLLKIKSSAPLEDIIRLTQRTDKSCHTVNSLRKHVPICGKLLLNEREHEIRD